MAHQDSWTTRLKEDIAHGRPWTQGHQLKGMLTFVGALIEQQTGTQAARARGLGNPEAARKRRSRLLHHSRLAPHRLAAAVLAPARRQLPRQGKVRLARDGTLAGSQHRLGGSLVTGGRAVASDGRADEAPVVTGRLRRDEMAVSRRAVPRGQQGMGRCRLSGTAARGFAEVALVAVRSARGVECISRVTGRTTVCLQGQGRQLETLGFAGHPHQRTLGHLASCASAPPRLWVTLSRARDAKGQWEIWYVIAHRPRRAQATAAAYARRCGGEQGCRDAKGELGFAQARSRDSHAWSRRFAWFALALLGVVSVAVTLLLPGGLDAVARWRRVAARRRGRWDLSLVRALVRLLHAEKGLFAHLSASMKFNLAARLVYVS